MGGNGIVGLRLTPNGQFLVSALYEAEVQVWDLARQQVTQILESHAIYGTMAINSDSSTLATRSSSGDCHLWDITTGQRLQVFHIPRLYEGMNLVGTTGLTPAQQANLQVLGAMVS